MGKTYSRIQRGQVYWFNPAETYGEALEFRAFNGKIYNSSVQNFNRPWLVTSNNDGNNTSPTCCIVPITLEDKAEIPTHVHFTYEGKPQTILCEQPKTVDCLALKDYIYTVSDSVMEQVEKAIAIQHGIRPQVTYADFTLDSTIRHLEVVIANIIASKVEQVKQELQKEQPPVGVIPISQIEDAALNLGQTIEELVGSQIKPVVQSNLKSQSVTQQAPKSVVNSNKPKTTKTNYQGMSAIEKFNARYNLEKQEEEKKEEPLNSSSTTKRNTWTTESRLQYLKDCDEMSPREIQMKYGFKSIQSVFQMKYLHKNTLVKAGILQQD